MFDFLHSILKWQFLAYFTISFAIGMARANLLTLLQVNAHRVQGDSCTARAQLKELQSCCADKRSVRFVSEVSAYKSVEGAIQIINK